METINLRKERKKSSVADLQKLSKEELIDKLICSEAHNTQLKNIIAKQIGETNNQSKKNKTFDFSRSTFRHVLLKFYYLGWDYQGYVTQEDTIKTIEHNLFDALTKTCLIKDRASSNYHRCGRTDKGVSSFAQTISIDLRSKLSKEEQNNVKDEINYCKILNRVLPDNIQCISWCPVRDDYSARFDCKSRTYKYFFPKANLNIKAMKNALPHLIGTHDFRNFCKMDVANGVVSFIRKITNAQIEVCAETSSNSPYEMYQLIITGKAFLWHQIRCIVAILFLIGENKEKPEIIQELLDVEKNPRKPDYNLADEVPLNLFYCEYDETDNWVYDITALSDVIHSLQKIWTISSVKTSMIKTMLNELENIHNTNFEENLSYESMTNCLVRGVRSKTYKSLMERQKCESLENRIQHYVKKRRIDDTK